jgi:hypothetical protein
MVRRHVRRNVLFAAAARRPGVRWRPVAGVAAVAMLASQPTACDGGATPGGPAGAAMTPTGMPLAHMDTARTMTAAARGGLADMCAVDGGAAADRGPDDGEPRVALVADAAAATRPTRLRVEVATATRAGVGAELLVGASVRASCAGMTLMITGPGVGMPEGRLRLTSRRPVLVVARTTGGRTLAGPVRVGPGAPGSVLEWGDGRQ